jgi:hypothetical protein
MIISHKRHFIFVHIYKNAGTSINAALMPYVFYNPVHWLFYKVSHKLQISLPFNFNPQPLPEHSTASEIINMLGCEKYAAYFSFAVIRNPWDWQVSLYTFMLKQPMNPQHELIRGFRDFNEYIHWRCSEDVHFQKDFVYAPDGSQLVDFMGRYENLNQDFKKICERIGIQTSLPMLNVSKSRPYQSYYTPETIELVRRTFMPDIELLGYGFE